MAGFARAAGTTGGLGRAVFTVTDAGDAPYRVRPPAGSLRDAVQRAGRAGGGWITFDPALGANPVIRLQTSLRPPSNVTIDGGCSGVALAAEVGSVIVLKDVSNVVLMRLRIRELAANGQRNGDCVGVGGASDRVWIAYNWISRCGDGLIDITKATADGPPTRVTVAHNLLSDHDKAMLVGTLDCQHQDAALPCPAFLDRPWSWARGVQLTLHDNLFLRTGQRNPKLSGLAYAHMYRNALLLAPWMRATGQTGALYGAYASNGARLFAAGNLIVTDRRSGRPPIWVDGNDAPKLRRGGARAADERGARDGALAGQTEVPDPPYPAARVANRGPDGDFVATIAAHAGPNGV